MVRPAAEVGGGAGEAVAGAEGGEVMWWASPDLARVRWAYLYVMGYDRAGPLKIGRALDVPRRQGRLQTGGYRTLHVYSVFDCFPSEAPDLEREVHKFLSAQWLRGEWFDVPVEGAINAIWNVVSAWRGKGLIPQEE